MKNSQVDDVSVYYVSVHLVCLLGLRHLKNTIVPVIVEALGMIKKDRDNHIKKTPGSPSLYKIPPKCTLRNSSSPLGSTINVVEKISPKRGHKNINTYNTYDNNLPSR